jgi:hypothetical protein
MKVKLEILEYANLTLYTFYTLSCKTKYNSTYFDFIGLDVYDNGNYCASIKTFSKDAKIKYRFCQVTSNKIVEFAESIENQGECNLAIDTIDSSLILEAVKPIDVE